MFALPPMRFLRWTLSIHVTDNQMDAHHRAFAQPCCTATKSVFTDSRVTECISSRECVLPKASWSPHEYLSWRRIARHVAFKCFSYPAFFLDHLLIFQGTVGVELPFPTKSRSVHSSGERTPRKKVCLNPLCNDLPRLIPLRSLHLLPLSLQRSDLPQQLIVEKSACLREFSSARSKECNADSEMSLMRGASMSAEWRFIYRITILTKATACGLRPSPSPTQGNLKKSLT